MARSTALAGLLRDARTRAGLSQRALAKRARTTQSVVARIELGAADPSTRTLARLLRAAGFDLRGELSPRPVLPKEWKAEAARILAMTPEDRLREVANVERLRMVARRV